MTNLVEKNYLHSSKKTFFNYMANHTNLDPRTENRASKLQSSIDYLNKLKKEALSREQEFYKDFSTPQYSITNAKQWSQYYLINQNNNSDSAKILKIINSKDMIAILSTGGKDFEVSRKRFIKELEKLYAKKFEDKIAVDIVSYLITQSENSLATSMAELWNDIGILGKGSIKVKNKHISNKQIQQMLFKNAGIKLPERLLTGLKSEKINKEYTQAITKITQTEQQRAQMALNFLKQKLQEEGFSQNKIDVVVKAFDYELKQNLKKGAENRLVTSAQTNVIGEVSEVGEVIAYIDFDDPFETKKNKYEYITGIKSRVIQVGRETNAQGKKSKTDTIWIGNSKKQYFIQNKNSNAEIYRAYQLTNSLDELQDIPTYLPVQSDTTLTHLLTNLAQTGYLSPEDEDSLIYLLINYNVLSKYGKENERIAKGENKQGIQKAEYTQAAIDQIISKGIQYFMSDFALEQNELGGLETRSNDFFIFMDRVLIPKSLIIEKLIDFFNNFKNETMRLYTTSYLTGFSESDYNDMNYEKIQARLEEEEATEEKIKYDYHNENLVSAGSGWGTLAKNMIKIRKISVKFVLKNLVQDSLI